MSLHLQRILFNISSVVIYSLLASDKISKKEYSTDKGKPPNTVLDNGSFWEFGLYGKIQYVNQSMNKTDF